MKCIICDSYASSLHFGAPSCKACAAFFRRTVALNITYECIGNGKTECEINFERRMACKRCRYNKCITSNMKRDMVQSKRGRVEMDPPSPARSLDLPSTSTNTSDDLRGFADQFAKMDSNLNKSRRMAFTESTLVDIFSGICKMPFEKRHLRPFDFRTYSGYLRSEYIMMFNYSNNLPDFQKLSNSDQNFLFRCVCGVDYILSSAYYTHSIGIEHNLLVNHDGTCVQMKPLPLLGDEPEAAALFPGKDDCEKYKNLITPRIKWWLEFQPIYSQLNLRFEENSLLRALASWQIANFKFDERGRRICQRQQTKIIRSLIRITQDELGEEEGAVRAGTIILFVSMVSEKVLELVSNLIVLSFFDIMDSDKLINEILSPSTLFYV